MNKRSPLSNLTRNWSPEKLAALEAERRTMAAEAATLEEVRVALGVSQEQLADLLDVQQPAVSKLERRNDMRISTLRDVVEALGGELHLVAKFPDRTIDLALAES